MKQENIMPGLDRATKISQLKQRAQEYNIATDKMYRDMLHRFTLAQTELLIYIPSQETCAAEQFTQLINAVSLTGNMLHDISQLVVQCKAHTHVDESSIGDLDEDTKNSYFERENAFWDTMDNSISTLQASLNRQEQQYVSGRASAIGYFGRANHPTTQVGVVHDAPTEPAPRREIKFVRLEDVKFTSPSPSPFKLFPHEGT